MHYLWVSAVIVDCSLRTVHLLPKILGTSLGGRHGIEFGEPGLNLIRKYLFTPMTFVPLLHQWAYIARLLL